MTEEDAKKLFGENFLLNLQKVASKGLLFAVLEESVFKTLFIMAIKKPAYQSGQASFNHFINHITATFCTFSSD